MIRHAPASSLSPRPVPSWWRVGQRVIFGLRFTVSSANSLRAWHRFFAGPATGRGERVSAARGLSIFAARTAGFSSAQGLIRAFYCFNLFLTVTRFPEFLYPGRIPSSALLLWPVAWLALVPSTLGYLLVFGLHTAGSLLGALFCGWRAARVLAFLGLLELIALDNSKVKIGHSMHLLVLVAFLLVFLPARWEQPAALTRRITRECTLLVFWACQATVMLSYTMSGLGKLGGAFYQVALGQPNVFSPDALALHTAERLAQTDSTSLLGSWLLAHSWAGWPLMLLTFYLQLFAFWVPFRPALGRWWAAGLIGFHAGSFFLMTINFPQNCFLLALFFFKSPFLSVPEPGWRRIVKDAPLFGSLFRRWLSAAAKSPRPLAD